MLARDIITTTATYLQLTLPRASYNDSYTAELNNQLATNVTLVNMLMCLNNILAELACDYVPNVKRTAVIASDGFVAESQLEDTLLEVIKLKDSQGNDIMYRHAVGGLLVEHNGELDLVYTTTYDKVNYLDNIAIASNKIDTRVLAYGLASEYCLLVGDYDNMSLWDNRYKNCLLTNVKRHPITMPNNRRWS